MTDIEVPEIRFADSRGGARIAYQVVGSGNVPIMSIPPMAQNIEMSWGWPDIRAMLERFGSFSTFVHFDKLGTGSSDRHRGLNTVDAIVDDVRAVMDAVGFDAAHFFATSGGGPMALLFAAAFPDRVLSLVLNGTWATRTDGADLTREEISERVAAFANRWGTPESDVVDRFAPSLADDPGFREWHQRYERASATPDSLRELMITTLDFDVVDVLPHISAPTLVIHRTGDRVVPVELGRVLAAGIEGAVMIELDGSDHFNYAGGLDWMDDVERFITGTVSSRPRRAATAAVRIVTLGRFAVEVDGEEVPVSEWGSKRARQLTKRLVAARGWPVTRDELMDMLWPDEHDLPTLSARLSVQLSGVRRVLGGGVVADRQTVRLNVDEVGTDLEDFFAAESDAAIVEAYAGEFLPEDQYDDWSTAMRDEARARFVGAAKRLGEAALSDGDGERAAALGRRLVEADPYADDGHRLLVKGLTTDGLHREAERAHARWREAFEELGAATPPLGEVVGR